MGSFVSLLEEFGRKFEGATPQIDFGNFAVGIATASLAFVTFFVALGSDRRASRGKIADLRSRWLEQLREAIALHSKLAHELAANSVKNADDQDQKRKEFFQRIAEMRRNETNIRLLLNPKEKLHVDIHIRLEKLRSLSVDLKTMKDMSEYRRCNYDFVNTSSMVIKEEWAKIKLELNGWGPARIYAYNSWSKLWDRKDHHHWPKVAEPETEGK